MWNSRKSAILSLILIYVFMVLLVVGMILLPVLVTWYVEYKGREASLPTTIMLTLYPCAPFAAASLWFLKNVVKEILSDNGITHKTVLNLKNISWCSFAVMAVMLFSGRYYLPFYVCAMCAAFIGLILRVVKNVIEQDVKQPTEETSETEEKTENAEEIENEEAD